MTHSGCLSISLFTLVTSMSHRNKYVQNIDRKSKHGNLIRNSVSKINSPLAPKPSEPRRLSGWGRGEINLLTILKQRNRTKCGEGENKRLSWFEIPLYSVVVCSPGVGPKICENQLTLAFELILRNSAELPNLVCRSFWRARAPKFLLVRPI